MLETGLSWRREGGGARPTDHCCRPGCGLDLLHFTRACLPFIHPFRAVHSSQRMRMGPNSSVLPSLYRLTFLRHSLLELGTFKINFPFDYFLSIHSTGFPLRHHFKLSGSKQKVDPRAES